MTLVVHPHFHGRRTGVTRHVELVVPALAPQVETRVLGRSIDEHLPKTSWGALLSRARRDDVVWHAHRNNEMLWGLLLRLLRRRVHLVFTRHASTPPSWLTRFVARRADRLVALTDEIARVMQLPSTVVPHGIDLARFSPPADRSRAWKDLGVGGEFGIGVIGRVRPAKGQGDFVEAIAPLLEDHPSWRAALVGLVKGEDASWLEALQRRTGASLALPGEQHDVVPWYRGLSVVVHPSHTEGYSMVHLEALASGACVVSSKLPYVSDLIEHGRTGFLYAPGDVAALREILAMLLREPSRAAEVGRNAAEAARPRFGVEREAEALAELYRAVSARP